MSAKKEYKGRTDSIIRTKKSTKEEPTVLLDQKPYKGRTDSIIIIKKEYKGKTDSSIRTLRVQRKNRQQY